MEKGQDRVVIVSGAGSGIGRGVAQQFAKKGNHVIIAGIEAEKDQETAELIRKEGGHAIVHPTDVRKPEDIVDLMNRTEDRFGRLDVLINNAGVSKWKSPYELTVEEWDDILHINLRGYFLCAREAAKIMRKAKKGSIVNIASTRAFMSEPDTEAYAASKGGIIALTHALAVSFAPDHIQVNAISPGWIETGDYSELRDIDHTQHPSGRVGTPIDIAKACLYLTEEDNDFITGTNLMIDGGMTRKMIYEH
jgi:NAD(P)-dependent dehydrogenase (short-subunit alcohol dehydrogenase family)